MDSRALSGLIDGKNILITGGTGSFGRASVSNILKGSWGKPERVVVFSRDEAKQHDMRTAFQNGAQSTDDLMYEDVGKVLRFAIGDVRSPTDISRALDGIDIVIHAAALKQVPACEYFPDQAIMTNCLGAMNLVEAIRTSRKRIECVVGLSTDKACQPINVMGMSKAVQERVFVAANLVCDDTRFVVVRYGNIAMSRGSVMPLFMEQLRLGRPITLTSRDMTRFLMPVSDAVDTVYEAVANGMPGETIVKVAPSVRIVNLIDALAGGKDIPIEITGVRPGEKLHELLISQEECSRTTRIGQYFHLAPMLPGFAARTIGGDVRPLKEKVSSDKNVLDLQATHALVRSLTSDLDPSRDLAARH